MPAGIEDDFLDDPRVSRLSNAAVGAWTKALCWSARYLTDGRIPASTTRELRLSKSTVKTLVANGLWVEALDGSGWIFSEFESVTDAPAIVSEPKIKRLHASEYEAFLMWPFQNFDCAYQALVDAQMDATGAPSKRVIISSLCRLPSRAFAEWHARRKRDPRKVRQHSQPEPWMRSRVIEYHGMICWLCNRAIDPTPKELHLDHVIPTSKGGPTTIDNLRPAHARCNMARGNRTPEHFRRMIGIQEDRKSGLPS